MVGEDSWAVFFGGVSDYYVQKVIRCFNVVFLRGEIRLDISGGFYFWFFWGMRLWGSLGVVGFVGFLFGVFYFYYFKQFLERIDQMEYFFQGFSVQGCDWFVWKVLVFFVNQLVGGGVLYVVFQGLARLFFSFYCSFFRIVLLFQFEFCFYRVFF